jgi:hypothetical protein
VVIDEIVDTVFSVGLDKALNKRVNKRLEVEIVENVGGVRHFVLGNLKALLLC